MNALIYLREFIISAHTAEQICEVKQNDAQIKNSAEMV